METEQQLTKKNRSISFYIALALLSVLFILSLNTDLQHFSQRLDTGVPNWLLAVLFSIDAATLVSILLIYFYKKIGVIALPILVLAHFLLHSFYLSTVLFSDMNLLFMFVGAGLLVIIPRWAQFR